MNYRTSAELKALEEYVKTKNPGERLSYTQIQLDTGLTMNTANKQKLRTALKNAGIEYDTDRGNGIVLADAKNGVSIIKGRMHRISTAIKRGKRSHENIQSRFIMDMSEDDRKATLLVGAVFSAMEHAKKQLASMPINSPILANGNTPVLPGI